MRWISKQQPTYIFLDDEWLREIDWKVFKPCIKTKSWVFGDISVSWPDKPKIMKHRDK